MTRSEIEEKLRNGEGSDVEFKLDDVTNYNLAKEIVALANFMGGVILLGVDDTGSVQGVTRPDLEAWVMEVCRTKIDPPLIPYFARYRDFEPGKDLAIINILPGPDRPYARHHDHHRTYYIRVGSTSREAAMDELQRLFVQSGQFNYGIKPVPGATMSDLDPRRLANYAERILQQPLPEETEERERLLLNLELMVSSAAGAVPTIDGMLLFGRNPKKFLPQSGIRAISYSQSSPDYSVISDEDLQGGLVALRSLDGTILESGLVEQALDFINRHAPPRSTVEMGTRVDRSVYPLEVLREAIVNALVHRDYSIHGTDIMLALFPDRLELTSPGRLPNGSTVEALRAGFRYARNQTLINVMRDYQYVDFRGMGIRYKIIPGMQRHNGTAPDFIATDRGLTVLLRA